MIKAVVFDMDGVLIQSESIHNKTWFDFFSKYNVSLNSDDYHRFRGVSVKESIQKYMPHIQEGDELNRLILERGDILEENLKGSIELVKGVREFLEKLKEKSIPFAVATSATELTAKTMLSQAGLYSYFSILVTANDVKKAKPDPEVYLLAAKRLGVNPSECIVFEDALSGVESAQRAGARVVVLTTTHKKEEFTGVKYFYPNFTGIDVSKLLKDFFQEAA